MTVKVSKEEAPEQRMVWGEVYAPDRPDAQGEFMRAETIRKMAHAFVRSGRMTEIDHMHDNKVDEERGLCIVESFIARKGDPDFLEGSWVIGLHVPDDAMWAKIKKGEINGFSIEAMVTRHTQDVEVEMPPVVTGKTSKSEEHEHNYFVSYDDAGSFKGGVTDTVNGHNHRIRAGTHTEETGGHSHRFSSVDSIKIV